MQPNLQKAHNLRNAIRGGVFDKKIRQANLAHEKTATLPMDKDSVMMQPTDQWDAIDRGSRGKIVSHPSRRFKDRWDEINWKR